MADSSVVGRLVVAQSVRRITKALTVVTCLTLGTLAAPASAGTASKTLPLTYGSCIVNGRETLDASFAAGATVRVWTATTAGIASLMSATESAWPGWPCIGDNTIGVVSELRPTSTQLLQVTADRRDARLIAQRFGVSSRRVELGRAFRYSSSGSNVRVGEWWMDLDAADGVVRRIGVIVRSRSRSWVFAVPESASRTYGFEDARVLSAVDIDGDDVPEVVTMYRGGENDVRFQAVTCRAGTCRARTVGTG